MNQSYEIRTPTEGDHLRAQALFQQGLNSYTARRYAEALEKFEQAAAMDPTLARAHTARVHALIVLGRHAEALESIREVIAREPSNPFAYTALGTAYRFAGNRDEARRAFEQALALAPDEPNVQYNVACFYAESGDEEACRRHLTAALRLSPKWNSMAAVDEDFGVFSDRPWFQELVAFK